MEFVFVDVSCTPLSHYNISTVYMKYSYVINSDILTMRANMTGYQSNVDYISSDYGVYYES
ncbi:MAG: hypothetical protein LBU81_03920 [Methanosarcinales archaeon]|jgi:hypothetical protein|nr:hypothetical protein [Methanosarcinales archaeon]